MDFPIVHMSYMWEGLSLQLSHVKNKMKHENNNAKTKSYIERPLF